MHRNKTARRRAAVPQGIESGDSRAQKRRGFGIAERIRYGRQRFDGSDHVLLVSSVVAKAGKLRVPAVKETSTATLDTGVVVSAVVADPHALPLGPHRNTGAQFIDHANNFVPRDPRILKSRPQAFLHKHITVADAASLYPDQDLAREGALCKGPVDRIKPG